MSTTSPTYACLDIWPIFAAWVAVAISVAGVYSFVRTVGTPVVNAIAERARPSPPTS